MWYFRTSVGAILSQASGPAALGNDIVWEPFHNLRLPDLAFKAGTPEDGRDSFCFVVLSYSKFVTPGLDAFGVV